jgi:hypothetical protein
MDPSHPVAAGSRAGLLPELPERVAVPEDVAEEAERALAGCGLFTIFPNRDYRCAKTYIALLGAQPGT